MTKSQLINAVDAIKDRIKAAEPSFGNYTISFTQEGKDYILQVLKEVQQAII